MGSIIGKNKTLRELSEIMYYIEKKDKDFTTNIRWLILKSKYDKIQNDLRELKNKEGCINEKNRPN